MGPISLLYFVLRCWDLNTVEAAVKLKPPHVTSIYTHVTMVMHRTAFKQFFNVKADY